MKSVIVAIALAALAVTAMPSLAQQPETGPKATGTSEHPLKTPETGVRGPSGGSPDTGPHGQRDVTKDAEPSKPKSSDELKQTGQPQPSPK